MGGGKGGGGTSTQYSGVQIPQEVLQRYNKATDRAENVSQQPWSDYGGQFVAPVNETQQAGYNTMMGGQAYTNAGWQMPNQSLAQGVGTAAPLFDQASGSINTGQVQGQALTAAGLGQAAQSFNQAQPYNQQAGQAYGGAYGGAQPYNMAATNLAQQGMQGVDPSQLNVQQFYNPYQQDVVQATMAQLGQQQAQQRNDQRGQMIREGSFGGDRSGVANANMVNQQNLATGSVLSQLNQGNYNQALAAAQQQQGVGLGAAQANRQAIQQGAGQMLGIGQQGYQQGMGYGQAQQGLGQQAYQQGMGQAAFTGQMGQQAYGQGVGAGQAQAGLGQAQYGMYGDVAAKQAALAGQAFGQNMQTAQGQMGFGTMQQQTQQAQDSALYNQWLQQQGYPFQASQFYTNAVMGTGPLSGSSAYSGSFTPQPFFSDDRVKENMEQIGRTHDGQAIYRFNYKGQPERTQIGLSAQEVEKSHPEAVSEHGGIKAVEYSAATDEAARPHRQAGGSLPPGVGILGVPPTLPTAGPTELGGFGDIVARQKAMFGANAPGSGVGSPSAPPSQAGISTPGGPPQGQVAPAAPGAAASPLAAALTEAGPRAVPSYIDPGGSANGATGSGGDSTGGVSGTGGVGGSASDGAGGSAAAGVGGDDGGTYASGGRTGYAKGGSKADGYAGGFGDLDNIMAAQAAMYGNAPWAQKAAAGTGSIIPQLQAAKASPLIKPPEQKAPAQPQKTGAQEGLGAANDAVKTAKSVEEAYGMGKDVLVGEPQKGTPGTPAIGTKGQPGYVPATPASANYKPATGGWFGHGGKWGADDPTKATADAAKTAATEPAPSPAATAPPTSVSPNPAATTLPAPPVPSAAPVQVSDAVTATKDLGDLSTDTNVADLSGLYDTTGLLADAGNLGDAANLAETGTAVADVAPVIEDTAMFAKKGGRIGFSGIDKDSSAVPFSGTSILPEGVYDPEDPSKPIEPPKPEKEAAAGGGGGGTDAGDVAAMAAPLAGAAIGSVVPGIGTVIGGLAGGLVGGGIKMARGKHAAGGEVNDNEEPEPGLAPAAEAIAPADNVHYGIFSRSQGHKMVGRATDKYRARRIRDKRDDVYGAYDHFIKPIPPSRKRAYGGRLAYADAGEVTDEDRAAEDELVREKLRQREAEALGAARTEPAAVEPTPVAQEILKGVETARAQPAPGVGAAEQQVAGPGMPAPPAAAPGLGTADQNIVPVQAAPPPPPPPPPQPPTEEPKPAPPGAGGGTPAGLPSYPVPAGERRLVGDIYYTSNGDGTWMPDQPAVTAPKPSETPKPTQVPQQATPTTRGGNSHNIGNVKTFDGKDTFQAPPTFDDGVGLLVHNASSYAAKYNQGKPMTIAEIGAHWAPVGSKDDPNNLNANWPKNVAAAYKAAGFDPNVPVDFSNPDQAAAFAKAVHQAEHGKSYDLEAYKPGVAKAGDPAVRKGFGTTGVGGATTTAAGGKDESLPVPSDSGLGAASPQARSLWGDAENWVDRNERYIVPGLTFLGGMLSSPSRTLAGSIGTGLVAGAQQYGTLGQRQQGIDIQKQQQNISQAGKIFEGVDRISRQRANFMLTNPGASTKAYDDAIARMQGKGFQLLAGVSGSGLGPTDAANWAKSQPPAIQNFHSQVREMDDPFYLTAIAAQSTDEATRTHFLNLAASAAERARKGELIGKSGQVVHLDPALEQQMLEMERRKQAAAQQGTQGPLQAAVTAAQTALENFELKTRGRARTTEEQAQWEQLTAALAAARAAAGKGPSMQARGGRVRDGWWKGGRIGKADGGPLTADQIPTEGDQALVETAPEPKPLATVEATKVPTGPTGIVAGKPTATATATATTPKPAGPAPGAAAGAFAQDPVAIRARAAEAAAAGLGKVAEDLYAKADEIEKSRTSSGVTTKIDPSTGQQHTEITPGTLERKTQETLQSQRLENNQRVDIELQKQAQAAAVAVQQIDKMRNAMFDKDGNERTSMGPASAKLNEIAAWLKQAGVDASLIEQLASANPEQRDLINKLATQLNSQLARGAYGTRPTEEQSANYQATIPTLGMQAATAKFLLDNILRPQAIFNRDMHENVIQKADPAKDNFGHLVTNYITKNPQFTPGALLQSPRERAGPAEKALEWNPKPPDSQIGSVFTNPNGHRMRYHGNGQFEILD